MLCVSQSRIGWLEFLPAPDRLDAPAAEVHVWRGDLDERGWPGADRLPDDERQRAAAILRPPARQRWVASRWLLRGVLARYLGRSAAEIGSTPASTASRAWPSAAGGLAFNLSHSEHLALVAVVADREVGVDVERIVAERDPVALAEKGARRRREPPPSGRRRRASAPASSTGAGPTTRPGSSASGSA